MTLARACVPDCVCVCMCVCARACVCMLRERERERERERAGEGGEAGRRKKKRGWWELRRTGQDGGHERIQTNACQRGETAADRHQLIVGQRRATEREKKGQRENILPHEVQLDGPRKTGLCCWSLHCYRWPQSLPSNHGPLGRTDGNKVSNPTSFFISSFPNSEVPHCTISHGASSLIQNTEHGV